jgi:hypothetical protein
VGVSQQAALNNLRRWRRYEENDRRNNVTSPINRAGPIEDLIGQAVEAGCSPHLIARETGLSVQKIAGMTTRTSRS